MKLVAEKKPWNEALAAMRAGQYARHAHWVVNQPAVYPSYRGPTALGVDPSDANKFAVFSADGVLLHRWDPSPGELVSEEWMIVDLIVDLVVVPASGPLLPPPRARRRPAR